MASWSKPRFASRDALKEISDNFCDRVVLKLVFCYLIILMFFVRMLGSWVFLPVLDF